MRGREVARRVQGCIGKCDAVRFATFTLADDGKPLGERLDRIYASFKSMRQGDDWKRYVRGAVATAETTLGVSRRHWHLHLHVLMDGTYFPHALLKKAWKAATGDSDIVHVKAVPSRQAAAAYIATYVAKPIDVFKWTDAELREYATAMHGRRLLATSGTMHNVKSDEDDTDDVPPPSTHLCMVQTLTKAAEAGSDHARHAREVLARVHPNLAVVLGVTATASPLRLTPIQPWESKFAVGVCEELERCYPELPPAERLEAIRRNAANEPEQPPPLRLVQGTMLGIIGYLR